MRGFRIWGLWAAYSDFNFRVDFDISVVDFDSGFCGFRYLAGPPISRHPVNRWLQICRPVMENIHLPESDRIDLFRWIEWYRSFGIDNYIWRAYRTLNSMLYICVLVCEGARCVKRHPTIQCANVTAQQQVGDAGW